MGHLVNPLLYRLNYSAFWNGSLIAGSRLDNYINVFSVYFSNFVRGYFKNYNWVDKNFLFVLSLKFFLINKNIFVYIDFWQNSSFKRKYKPYTKIIRYFFTSALKNKFLKFKNFKKKKTSFNFYAWKKFYLFKKKLVFSKKKINYKFFFKKFLNFKTKFINRNRRKLYQFQKNVIVPVSKERRVELFNYFLGYSRNFIWDLEAPVDKFLEIRKKRKVFYNKEFLEIYLNYCKYFSVKFFSPDLNHFYNFCENKILSPKISVSFWYDFIVYKQKFVYGRDFFNHYLMFICLNFYLIVTNEAEKARIEIKKKEEKKILDSILSIVRYKSNYKSFRKKIFFQHKLSTFKLKFLNYGNVNLLKKKKLKNYLYSAKKSNYKMSIFAPRKSLFYNRYIFKLFHKTKRINKKKFKKSTKKSWWIKNVFSLFLKKRKPYYYKSSFKRLLHAIKNKRSFFKKFKFSLSTKFYKNFKNFKKKFKLKKVFYKINVRRKKFKFFKNNKSNVYIDLRNFLKKNSFFSKIRFKYKIKINKFRMRWKNKRRVLFVRKKKLIKFKKHYLLRKFYIFNKPYFFFRKRRSPARLKRLSIIRRRNLIRAEKRKKEILMGLRPDPKKLRVLEKVRKRLRKWFFSRFGTNLDNNLRRACMWYTIQQKFKSFSDKPRPYLRRRYKNELRRAKKKSFRYIYVKKKFFLLLNFFYLYNKIYTLKKKFIIQASLLVNFFTKINVYFFIRSQFSFQISAELVAEFLVLWFLKKKFTVKEILGTLLSFLKKSFAIKNIGGYAILMRGRFTRKDRAMYSWKKMGAMPLSHRISNVDYCNRWIPLKYSQCAFKVYILKNDANYVRKKHHNVRKKKELKIAYVTEPD